MSDLGILIVCVTTFYLVREALRTIRHRVPRCTECDRVTEILKQANTPLWRTTKYRGQNVNEDQKKKTAGPETRGFSGAEGSRTPDL